MKRSPVALASARDLLQMSPFSFADKIKTPILLIHREADNNPGTFPLQSERLFSAIKGQGVPSASSCSRSNPMATPAANPSCTCSGR